MRNFITIIFLLCYGNAFSQNCEERFVDDMLAAYRNNNYLYVSALKENWPATYNRYYCGNGESLQQKCLVPEYSESMQFINICLVSGSKLGLKLNKGKGLLPKQEYLCYYDCNSLVFYSSLIISENKIVGTMSSIPNKRGCKYIFNDYDSIEEDDLFILLLDIKPDVVFRLSGQGNFITYYIKDKQLMAICSTALFDSSEEPYEILSYSECYEKYLKLPFFHFGNTKK